MIYEPLKNKVANKSIIAISNHYYAKSHIEHKEKCASPNENR